MRLLTGEKSAAYLEGIVHLDTQAAERGLDLTVAEVHRLTGPGALDFGGSEFEEAPLEKIASEKADPDDDYGWWTLDAGTYLIHYNEAAAPDEGCVALVFPQERLLKAGAAHPAFVVDERRDPLETLLNVGALGLRLKENARVSRLLIVEADV